MLAIGVRELEDALDKKANEIQRDFVRISEELADINLKLMEADAPEQEVMQKELASLRDQQKILAEEINAWRGRARDVLHQRTKEKLKDYLGELLPIVDGSLKTRVERSLYLLDASEEELATLIDKEQRPSDQTRAGRLIERARTAYDLRASDPTERVRAAVNFANQSGMALNDDALSEIEEAITDADPMVSEVATLVSMQIHRFRAMRVADLTRAHASVKVLIKIDHPSVVPVLIEVLENPRTGFVTKDNKTEETENGRSRMLVLLRLVKWHTPGAKMAIQMRKFDQDKQLVGAAERALELFPGEWTGPLEKGK
ncbi:MAG: hypothetical protein IIC78_00970 [Chloroflexi bacterium]|nr:hypothetical protein [Chloroflexota bacterium]